MSSTESIGIFGGSFNPVHIGHLLVAQEAWYRCRLSRVAFVPSAGNPLKDKPGLTATDAQRLNMLRAAVEDDQRFYVDAHDLRRGGTTYSVDTLMRFRELHPEADLYFILGADSAEQLHLWKDAQIFLQLCRLVIYGRQGCHDFSGGLPSQLMGFTVNWEYTGINPIDISSTDIRERLRKDRPIRYMVPDNVADYIHRMGIYDPLSRLPRE
jgi:nicotinate-nucleotide adenylyltransferase